jgi:hypothetical protein
MAGLADVKRAEDQKKYRRGGEGYLEQLREFGGKRQDDEKGTMPYVPYGKERKDEDERRKRQD